MKNQNPNELCLKHTDAHCLQERINRYHLLSEWLEDIQCPAIFCRWAKSLPPYFDCKSLLLLWQQAGRPQIEWPSDKSWNLSDVVLAVSLSCDISLANVRDQQASLASGATSCDSKNRDRSPGGTGLCCIALLGFLPIASSKSGPDPVVVTGLIICLILEIGLLVSMTKFLVNEYRSKKRENNRKDN